MRRFRFAALLQAALCVLSLVSCGELVDQKLNVALDGVHYHLASDAGYSVNYVDSGLTGAVTIPDLVEGKPVIALESYVFQYRTITSIALPASVASIGSYAFDQCTSLESVSFASGSALSSIGDSAFNNCQALTGLVLPEGVDSLGVSSFARCAKLTSVDIPDGVTAIPNFCFYLCSTLASVTFPSGLLSINDDAFEDCAALTAVELPEGLTVIAYAGFNRCSALASISLPSTISAIDGYAFSGCSALSSVTCAATSAPEITSTTFYGLSGLAISVPSAGLSDYQGDSIWQALGTITGY